MISLTNNKDGVNRGPSFKASNSSQFPFLTPVNIRMGQLSHL